MLLKGGTLRVPTKLTQSKKKLINKTQEFPIALNISICTNLFVNGLMTVAASSVYPIMTEAASSVYPNQMLITH